MHTALTAERAQPRCHSHCLTASYLGVLACGRALAVAVGDGESGFARRTECVEYLIVTDLCVGVNDTPSRDQLTVAPSTSKLLKIEAGADDSLESAGISFEYSSSGNLSLCTSTRRQSADATHTTGRLAMGLGAALLLHPSRRPSAGTADQRLELQREKLGEGQRNPVLLQRGPGAEIEDRVARARVAASQRELAAAFPERNR